MKAPKTLKSMLTPPPRLLRLYQIGMRLNKIFDLTGIESDAVELLHVLLSLH